MDVYVSRPDGIETLTEAEAVLLFGEPQYRAYVSQCYQGAITLEDVPEDFREAVRAAVEARTARWGNYADQTAEEAEVMVLARDLPKRDLTRGEAEQLFADLRTLRDGATDAVALQAKSVYPRWEDLVGEIVEHSGTYRFTHDGKLYRLIPTSHTFQADWVPGQGTESLYTRIDETHAGTQADPIPYEGNMALTAGLYYAQDGVTYLCTRDTWNPVYNALSALVGIYVEVAT